MVVSDSRGARERDWDCRNRIRNESSHHYPSQFHHSTFIINSSCVHCEQYPDTPTFVKTMHFLTTRHPHLILVPVAALGSSKETDQLVEGRSKGEPTLLVRCLRDTWGHASVIGVARKYWSEQAGAYSTISRIDSKLMATSWHRIRIHPTIGRWWWRTNGNHYGD